MNCLVWFTNLWNNIFVPATDSADNETIRDVIGSKLDTHDGDSIRAVLHTLDDHIHGKAEVHPSLADGIVVTATANDWTDLGAFAVIAATNAITFDFDIHYISIENISANGVYELVLYSGADAAEVEIGRKRFAQNAVQDSIVNVPFRTPIIPANTQIKAKLASDNAVANTVTITLAIHPY